MYKTTVHSTTEMAEGGDCDSSSDEWGEGVSNTEEEGGDGFPRLNEYKMEPGCKKQKKKGNYHDKFITCKTALEISDGNDVGAAIDEDACTILKHIGCSRLAEYLDSIVLIEVRKPSIFFGTGFVIEGDSLVVVTNYHKLFSKDTGTHVDPDAVRVFFFHDGVQFPVVCKVLEFMPFLNSDKTRDRNHLGDKQHLDYCILVVDENGISSNTNSDYKVEVKNKFKLDDTVRIEAIAARLTLPDVKGIALMCIGHPHGAPKKLSFGKLETDPETFKEGDSVKERVSVEHTCATCDGSSGSLIFSILLKKSEENGAVKADNINVDDMNGPCLLHYRGDSNNGKAMTFQSIVPDIQDKVAEQFMMSVIEEFTTEL